jgi:hypothetical protein
MAATVAPRRAFFRTLDRAAPRAVRALARELSIPRRAAAEALGAAAGLSLAGLARHQRRRPEDKTAALGVIAKYGRAADIEAPDVGITAHLARPELSPRLGGLLGDTGPKAAAWLAGRSPGESAEVAGRALAAAAPLVLGALSGVGPPDAVAAWIATVPEAPLDDPAALGAGSGDPAALFRRVRRAGLPWWQRLLPVPG